MSARERGRRDAAGASPPAAAAPLAWLDTLEGRVRDAVERLAAATAENARLRARIAELEARPAASGAAAGAAADAGDDAAAAWRRERDEVRDRVRRLAESLEALLDEAS